MSMRLGTVVQDPDEALNYTFTLERWGHVVADPITSVSWPAVAGITLTGLGSFDAVLPSITTPRISGGTSGTDYQVEATILTTGGLTLQGHVLVRIK
jgi:hypothetical protein